MSTFLVFQMPGALPARAATAEAYVEPGGICGGYMPCWKTIQTAIDAAPDPAQVRVAEGAYAENVSIGGGITLEIGWDTEFTGSGPIGPVVLETPSVCGNGVVEVPYEACDDGRQTPTCDDDCTLPECGDGNLNTAAGEQCDDGATTDGDGCDAGCLFEAPPTDVPLNLFNAGDSIGEAEAAYDDLYTTHHESVWSTGYDTADDVHTFNERFEDADPLGYFENDASVDGLFNQALSGAEMADFAGQAAAVVVAAADTPSGTAGMLTVLMGNNDVCADSLETMTDPGVFESRFRAGLDRLAAAAATRDAYIHVSGLPAIYWLWVAKRSDFFCRVFVWPRVPCQNLLQSPADDCGGGNSYLNPDVIAADDGPNCVRRKLFHAKIRDVYNPILKRVVSEYRLEGRLPNAYFVDIFDIHFDTAQVNDADCFHPSADGQRLLAEEQWCRSPWAVMDPLCP